MKDYEEAAIVKKGQSIEEIRPFIAAIALLFVASISLFVVGWNALGRFSLLGAFVVFLCMSIGHDIFS